MDETANATLATTGAFDGGAIMTIVGIQLVISGMGWISTILSLNRFRGWCAFDRAELYAAAMYVFAALFRVLTALATRTDVPWVQAFLAVNSSLLVWSAFIVLFNDDIVPPTRQQSQAIVLGLVTTLMWELQAWTMVHAL
jgi:hypothetical protein